MKKFRSVEEVVSPSTPHMVGDGFKVVNFTPGGGKFADRMNPFYLLDFNPEFYFSPTAVPRGVGVHPHRGFETVTIAYKGSVAHNDSTGNSGIIRPGEVQWMTAGAGILHKEYHEKEFAEKGGAFEMAQVWVNLPRKFKKTAPGYQSITQSQKGRFEIPGNKGVIEVIAGEYEGIKGPAKTFSPVEMYDIHLEEDSEVLLHLPSGNNTGLLVVGGEVVINEGTHASGSQYIQFKNEPGEISVKAGRKSTLLLLSGEPINEPVAAYGPFVMNTIEEIQEAIDDLNKGRFGTLSN